MATRLRHPAFGNSPVPFGRVAEWNLKEHPDAPRIAVKPCGEWDVVAEVWPSRKALALAVRMQERAGRVKLRPVIRLTDGEGY